MKFLYTTSLIWISALQSNFLVFWTMTHLFLWYSWSPFFRKKKKEKTKQLISALLHYTIKPFSSKKVKQKKWIQNLYKILSFKNLKIYWLGSVFLFHLPWFHRNRQKSLWYIYEKSDPVLILYIFLILIVARNLFKLV